MSAAHTSTILLIEDNRDFAWLLSLTFEMMGYRIAVARNGCEGLQRAAELKPDLIFCDIGLPGLNGYEVAAQIRANPELHETFLIALTGYNGKNDVELAFRSGFNRHLSKPVDIASLKLLLDDLENPKQHAWREAMQCRAAAPEPLTTRKA